VEEGENREIRKILISRSKTDVGVIMLRRYENGRDEARRIFRHKKRKKKKARDRRRTPRPQASSARPDNEGRRKCSSKKRVGQNNKRRPKARNLGVPNS